MRTRDVLRDRQQWGGSALVSTGSSAATLAGLHALREGGNAFDAAVIASAVMTVAMPMASGPAGDVAAVLHVRGQREAWSLTGLGCAPGGGSRAEFSNRGMRTVPDRGILSASTPGTMAAWYTLARAHCTMPMRRLLQPAIELAERGVVVTQQAARWFGDNMHVLDAGFKEAFNVRNEPPNVGSTLFQPGLARLYEMLGDDPHRTESVVDAAVLRVSEALNGLFQRGDCRITDGAVLEPALVADVAGRRIAVNCAPTQGALLLQNLLAYARLVAPGSGCTGENIHLLSEVVHRSFAWRLANLGDPGHTGVVEALAKPVIDDIVAGVNRAHRSSTTYTQHYSHGDTTHLTVVDKAGNSVSWVQSLGLGFGAGVGVPALGLLLSNRLGRSSTLVDTDPNCVSAGRRPVNTIFAWSASDEGGVRWLGGTPGGDGQCQWNAQVLAAMLIHGESALGALNAPRWTYLPGADKHEANRSPSLEVDRDLPSAVVADLQSRGHDVRLRASVGGAVRLTHVAGTYRYGLDDGRQEGLTAGF
ncbi:gamma-glutamyltransferase [Cellulomonas sp. zg-B12]|nr:gamma-glutamyltransferase [Cellulomonas xiejunii]